MEAPPKALRTCLGRSPLRRKGRRRRCAISPDAAWVRVIGSPDPRHERRALLRRPVNRKELLWVWELLIRVKHS